MDALVMRAETPAQVPIGADFPMLANSRSRCLLLAAIAWVTIVVCQAEDSASAASYRTTNFVVHAATPRLAKRIGDQAESWRRELAIDWLGEKLPDWSRRCPIKASVSPRLGAGGATSFIFDG
ncbi:MAG: hypothetical protein N2C12_03655, partial [Planctomycetales bacterium]